MIQEKQQKDNLSVTTAKRPLLKNDLLSKKTRVCVHTQKMTC